jgi:plastocyanin
VAVLAAAPASAARRVKLGDDWFGRPGAHPTVTVSKGTVVRWRWTGRRQHDVHVRRGPDRFTSTLKRHGFYRHRMRRRGTYRIVCQIHQPGMRMKLIVR